MPASPLHPNADLADSGLPLRQPHTHHLMQRRRLLAVPLAAVAGLSACAAPEINDYRLERPLLDLRTYFNGTLDAWGMFTDRTGRIVKRFTVVMQCTWTGDDGVLDEAFTYADGTRQQRIWRLRHLGDGRYEGRADDVVGVARGESQGNTLRWAYTLALPVDGQVVQVAFDDWMVLMDERVMLNRAVMSKWGITLGEVTLSFTRRS
jgi:hypothetical protein